MRKGVREPLSGFFCVFIGDLGMIILMMRYPLVYEFISALLSGLCLSS